MRPRNRRKVWAAAGLGVLLSAASAAHAQTETMSAAWAKSACDAWNAEPVLTDELVKSGWAKNNAGRGFKVIQLYRTECKDSPRVELRIAEQDDKARCVYGGRVETARFDLTADYVMHAETARWQEMGRGEYGPMRAMMFALPEVRRSQLRGNEEYGPVRGVPASRRQGSRRNRPPEVIEAGRRG